MLILVAVTLAAVVVALAAVAASLRGRERRLRRELAEANEKVARLQKLGSLGEMASSFAHTFNNVLTPIIGRSQLLAQRVTDPQQRDWLETIERSALDGAHTVRRIQEFLRLRREDPAIAVDLGATVTYAVATTGPRQRPGIRIHTELDTLPPIAGDPRGLREAVENIVVNAIEAAPDGSTVTVSVHMDGGDAVISVTDAGGGMTPGVQARIFEPFFTTKPGAPGLGLCLTHGIVSRHGGQIEIDSAPGRGTTVRLKFPVEGVARAKPVAHDGKAGPGTLARCLVVDDDPQVRDMIRDVLANAGHPVVVAVDGADGVEKFKADSAFDLVITDLAMPKLNGLQLARVCKTLLPAVPVIMLTGWGVLLTEDELAEHGVDEVLSKPVRVDQLLGAIAAAQMRASTA